MSRSTAWGAASTWAPQTSPSPWSNWKRRVGVAAVRAAAGWVPKSVKASAACSTPCSTWPPAFPRRRMLPHAVTPLFPCLLKRATALRPPPPRPAELGFLRRRAVRVSRPQPGRRADDAAGGRGQREGTGGGGAGGRGGRWDCLAGRRGLGMHHQAPVKELSQRVRLPPQIENNRARMGPAAFWCALPAVFAVHACGLSAGSQLQPVQLAVGACPHHLRHCL